VNHTFVQSIKTIAESLIKKAGFDKTRSGKIVGKNEITNTYSVKIDGNVYNNVRVVNDCIYNVGDTVKVSIPCNQASQMYIMSSVFSDDSMGKKITHADSMIDALENQTASMAEIDGHIYQLNLNSTYTASSATYTGQVLRDGEDVTSGSYWANFHWYLLKNNGADEITTGISHASLTMQLADYKYGTALELVWAYSNDIVLRRLVVLFDNEEVAQVSQTASDAKTIADNTAQYFWYTSTGIDTGGHITAVPKDTFINNPQGYNLLTRSNGVAVRQALNELAVFTYDRVAFNAMVNNVLRSVAEYGATNVRIGLEDSGHVNVTSNSLDFYKNSTSKVATIVNGVDESGSSDPNIVGFYMPYGTYGASGFDMDASNYGSIALFRRENNSAMNTSGIVISRANASTSDVSLYNIRNFNANCNGYFTNAYSNGEKLHHVSIQTKTISISNLAHGTSQEGSVVLSSGGGTFNGYFARCVVGWAPSGTNSSFFRAWRLYVDQDKDGDGQKRTLEYGIRNEHSSDAVTGSLIVYILCTQ
jgi:hypothetical protein